MLEPVQVRESGVGFQRVRVDDRSLLYTTDAARTLSCSTSVPIGSTPHHGRTQSWRSPSVNQYRPSSPLHTLGPHMIAGANRSAIAVDYSARLPYTPRRSLVGASFKLCCYAALRLVSQEVVSGVAGTDTSRMQLADREILRSVSGRVVRPARIAGVRSSGPNRSPLCFLTKAPGVADACGGSGLVSS